MTLKDSSTKKIAAAACAVGILLFGAACTSTVSGAASYTGEGQPTPTEDTESTTSDDDDTTTSEDDDTTTSDETDETSAGQTDPDNPPAAAPDQPYQYENGVSLQLSAPTVDDAMDGLISGEVGRVFTLTFTNPSEATFDTSMIGYNTIITCPSSATNTDQYILDKSEMAPDVVNPGETATFTYKVGVQEDAAGTSCLVEITIESADYSNIDDAVFTLTL